MESFRALFATFTGVAGDKNSRETFNLQRSKGTTRICSTETFRLQLPAFSFLLCFFYFSSVPILHGSVWYSFFFFPCKKKTLQNCSSTRKRRFENVWICREILSGNFKWNFPVLWGEVSCNRCSTYTIVQFSVYPDLHPKIRRNFLRRGTSWLQIKRWETGKNIVSGS